MLETLDDVNWAELPQPAWNSPDEIPRSLCVLIAIESEKDAESAYHRVLFALGNNHGGTYYPVVLNAVQFLGETLSHGNRLVRETTLEIFLDLLASFAPEQGFETIRRSNSQEVYVKSALFEAIAIFRHDIQICASSRISGSKEQQLASEVLSLIEERPRPTDHI